MGHQAEISAACGRLCIGESDGTLAIQKRILSLMMMKARMYGGGSSCRSDISTYRYRDDAECVQDQSTLEVSAFPREYAVYSCE